MHIKTNLVLLPEEAATGEVWKKAALKATGLHESEASFITITRRSVDARSKQVKVNLSVSIFTGDSVPDSPIDLIKLNNVSNAEPVIIVGSGPAGIFAALRLISLGLKPIIIERGKNVKERRRDLAALNKSRIVNPDSNYCFGEGGAGTYSDGKLYTRSGKRGNIDNILQKFIHFGAPADIGIDSHPHIGTNKLPAIIESMRSAIIECGGEVHFNTRFDGLQYQNNKVSGVICRSINNSTSTFNSNVVILATGHSARDIYEYLYHNNIQIESKPFALGVRIEHPQKLIDKIQYHCDDRGPYLPAAPYTLSTQAEKHGVYSFCMCPGGIIAAAATAPGEVVVNGWSPSKRNNPYANSGMVVSVDDKDFAPFSNFGELRALKYQQKVEQDTFEAGGKNLSAPAQRVTDFIENKFSSSLPSCSYIPGIKSVNLKDVLPIDVAVSLRTALVDFGKKMRGYISNDAVLVATESRTSSPVRIPRDATSFMHPQVEGLFPCGEGPGYAGGIMSAAMDGEKVAEAAARYLNVLQI